MAAELVRARGPADVARLETQAAGREAGQVDHVFGREFDEFLLRTIAVSNRHRLSPPPARRLLSALRPPPFLWTYPHGRPYRLEEPIAAVRVYRVSSFFDGQSHSTFRRELLRTVAAKS
jgi:hypothetical protein